MFQLRTFVRDYVPAIGLLYVGALSVAAQPAKPHAAAPKEHFQTSDRCIACHSGISQPSGEDISIGFNWRASMMANSARDPYWQAAVRREVTDHAAARAAIEDECSKCHMPMARFESKAAGEEGTVFSHLPFNPEKRSDRLAADGVSCSVCHQIANEKLGTRESFVGGFQIETARPPDERPVYGPYEIDAGRARIMRSSAGFKPTEGKHIQKSELCATCHTLYTKALGPRGEVVGELPEQMPYLEWLNSDYREKQSCQDCHLPVVKERVPITSVLGKEREGFSRHTYLGGNFFVQRMLNLYRRELGVTALPQELDAESTRTVTHLQTDTARIAIERVVQRSGRLEAEIAVENLGGHKLPTAYPSRRAWLHVVVRDRNDRVVFESGAIDAHGAILGNDNDDDAAHFEPHYQEIRTPDQVQIYESILAGPTGAVTTGLLTAVRFVKDNRLLPRGFDKRNADKDIAVHGGAADDSDFTAPGDRVRYSVDVGDAAGPFRVDAELWFQPIGFRWAANLKPYEAEETRRFTRYYDAMSVNSALVLARASAVK